MAAFLLFVYVLIKCENLITALFLRGAVPPHMETRVQTPQKNYTELI